MTKNSQIPEEQLENVGEPETPVTSEAMPAELEEMQNAPITAETITEVTEAPVFSITKEQRVVTIPLPLLKLSGAIKAPGTNHPGPTRPLQSWALIDLLVEKIKHRGFHYELDPIWIEYKSSSRILTQAEEEFMDETNTPITKWVFQHVVGKIRIIMPERDDLHAAIAFSFNKSGITVVFGTNVRACNNLCIFGDNVISTYGNEKVPFNKQMVLLDHWLDNIESNFKIEVEVIVRLMAIELYPDDLLKILGDLYYQTSAYNLTKKKRPVLNTTVLGLLTEQIVNMQTEAGIEFYQLGFSLWQLYNMGTVLMKPETIPMDDLYTLNKKWSSFLMEKSTEIETSRYELNS